LVSGAGMTLHGPCTADGDMWADPLFQLIQAFTDRNRGRGR
jgi:hypothetical protein